MRTHFYILIFRTLRGRGPPVPVCVVAATTLKQHIGGTTNGESSIERDGRKGQRDGQ